MEPFRRFNVIFGLWSSALWTKFSKAVQGEGENSTEGDRIKPEKERKRLDSVTDTITVLVQLIIAWPWSKSCKLSSIGKMLSATQWPISLSYFTHLSWSSLSVHHIFVCKFTPIFICSFFCWKTAPNITAAQGTCCRKSDLGELFL